MAKEIHKFNDVIAQILNEGKVPSRSKNDFRNEHERLTDLMSAGKVHPDDAREHLEKIYGKYEDHQWNGLVKKYAHPKYQK